MVDGGAFTFLPVFAAQLTETSPSATYEGVCFQEIEFLLEMTSDTTFNVHMDLRMPKSYLCSEKFLIANTEIQHFANQFRKGHHTISLEMETEEGQVDFAFGGIKIYNFCYGFLPEIASFFETLKCFIGGLSYHPKIPIIGTHIPRYMAKANVSMIKEVMGLEVEKRHINLVDVDESLIKSGDFILIMRLDGIDPIIMYGTGSHGAHCGVLIWFPEEDGTEALYIVESQDAWYWPTKNI